MNRARVHTFATGLVQGVAFRYHAVQRARELGLAGWVRNLSDGRVEIVAEGEKPVLERFVSWNRHGPRTARVDDLAVQWEDFCGEFADFTVHY